MPRRALRSVLTSSLMGALVVGGALPAGAASKSAETWNVPAVARILVTGHGYGHGHGMSQYGAEGAARQGLSYRQIAGFYYPGTTWATAAGAVSVQVSADTTPQDLVVRARAGLVLRDSAVAGRVALPLNGATRWRIVSRTGQVSYFTDRWHAFSRLRGRAELAAGGAPITLVTPSGERAYRGRLRTALTAGGSPVTVNVLSLENYLRGVVPLEIPASWSPAAVQAQAVAARTYAAYERAHPRSTAFQLYDTTASQVYGGYAAEHPASDRAVRETRAQVLTAGGKPAFTQFGSSSGGWTSAGSVSYLPARKDPYDGWAGNPVHTWTVRLDDRAVERAWPRVGDLTGITVTSRDGHGDWGGRLRSLTLSGTGGRVVVSGDDFRSRLGLRSTWMTFRVSAR